MFFLLPTRMPPKAEVVESGFETLRTPRSTFQGLTIVCLFVPQKGLLKRGQGVLTEWFRKEYGGNRKIAGSRKSRYSGED